MKTKSSTKKARPKKKIQKKSRSQKIGVIICDCGGQIAEKIDVRILSKKSKELENVTKVRIMTNLCSSRGIKQVEKEFKKCDRMLFAGCS